MKGRPEYGKMPTRRLGYYGLRRELVIRGCPDWLWRAYWLLQPVRCLFGFHDWYDVCAGEAVACNRDRCHAFMSYPHSIAASWRLRPWMRKWEARVRDAEMRADFWYHEKYPDAPYDFDAMERMP